MSRQTRKDRGSVFADEKMSVATDLSASAPLLHDEGSVGRGGTRRRDVAQHVLRAVLSVAAVALVLAVVAFASAIDSPESRSGFGRLGQPEEAVNRLVPVDTQPQDATGIPRLPIYFHIEKTGGTSLVLYLMSLLADNAGQSELVQKTRTQDALFDSDLRASNLLCPGSAAFLTTVFVDNASEIKTFPKPLKDSSTESWNSCRLATSHQGQALQTIVKADMARVGSVERPFIPLGMFRDPVQFEQAAWRSELFMYHDDRQSLQWGTLMDHKFGTLISQEDLSDFGDASKFAETMRNVHCQNNRDNNYQTKKLIDDVWWRFQERMDKGDDLDAIHAESVDIALDRVEDLQWVGLTHRYEESVCALSFMLRRNPVDTELTNYDRGSLIGPAFQGNHPHSGDSYEGDMSPELKAELYDCNAMDTLLVKTAQKRFEENLEAMERELNEAVAQNGLVESKGFEREDLDPGPYVECLARARVREAAGVAVEPQGVAAGAAAVASVGAEAEAVPVSVTL